MIDLDLFFAYNCMKKGSKNIFTVYLRKLSQLRGQFCSTALVIDTFYFKYCSVLTLYYKIDLLIEITFLSNKNNYISRFFFLAILYDQKLLISFLSISIMSTKMGTDKKWRKKVKGR